MVNIKMKLQVISFLIISTSIYANNNEIYFEAALPNMVDIVYQRQINTYNVSIKPGFLSSIICFGINDYWGIYPDISLGKTIYNYNNYQVIINIEIGYLRTFNKKYPLVSISQTGDYVKYYYDDRLIINLFPTFHYMFEKYEMHIGVGIFMQNDIRYIIKGNNKVNSEYIDNAFYPSARVAIGRLF